MISVQEASQIIQQNPIVLETTQCMTTQAIHYILQEEIVADRDFPPFNRVTMDGIAIQYIAFQEGRRRFKMQSTQFAGESPHTLQSSEEAIEIMTGAVLPINADTVIRFEDIEIETVEQNRYAILTVEHIHQYQNIHSQGKDYQKNTILIPAGTILNAPEIAVAVSVGKTFLKVSQSPKIAIISTGNELVDTGIVPLPHQVRRSNVYAIQAALCRYKFDAELFHLPDDKMLMEKGIQYILSTFDILILSGGVSEGKADFIPEVLTELGVQRLFHKVSQRPGKPFWFGKKENKAIFALPGNPVSTIVCFFRYVMPYIWKSLGTNITSPLYAQLATDFTFHPPLTFFLGAKVEYSSEGILKAYPFLGNGSGDFTNLLNCDGFLELPAEQSTFKAGDVFPLWQFR